MEEKHILYIIIAILSIMLMINFLQDVNYRNINYKILEDYKNNIEKNTNDVRMIYLDALKMKLKYQANKDISKFVYDCDFSKNISVCISAPEDKFDVVKIVK